MSLPSTLQTHRFRFATLYTDAQISEFLRCAWRLAPTSKHGMQIAKDFTACGEIPDC